MTRKKQQALAVPASIDEARELLADYVHAERNAVDIRLTAQRQIDAIKQRRDEQLQLVATANTGRFAALKAWWEAGGKDIAGRKRSTELAGATLGIRKTPAAVKLKRGLKVDDAIAWIRKQPVIPKFIRIKYELNKPAIIKAAADKLEYPIALLEAGGITVEQVDEFFIDCGLDNAALQSAEATE